MLAEQRQKYILDQLSATGALAISELVSELDVSRETIRRDLNALATRGLLVLTHGGALAPDRTEPDTQTRAQVNAEGKRAIGVRAAELVRDGASLILDYGTTTHAVAQGLHGHHNLLVYTNDLAIAQLLGRRNGNRVIVLGGELQDNEDATHGWDTIEQLSRYHTDFAFIGIGGITPRGEICDFSRAAAELRSRMLLAADVACVVADHTKFGRNTGVTIKHAELAAWVITDMAPEPELGAVLKERGTKLLIA
ncbi:putative transcriptional regulator, DeoR (plasmid) [Cupriavidus taiwanensis]|uniref:Transcriptional regulator, DeoR n=1 Tax=Cupriavidus taiwanensis TaxID=164546 RepID=A0A9Q7XQV5_9BURK|nr:DeoR/GlpR family DNA-binding transcription regulator [Cupriavidus taiwanensis]SPD67316.1 putative transcriptional regulator, DeoR [Cupriavidus taiwanensis]